MRNILHKNNNPKNQLYIIDGKKCIVKEKKSYVDRDDFFGRLFHLKEQYISYEITPIHNHAYYIKEGTKPMGDDTLYTNINFT